MALRSDKVPSGPPGLNPSPHRLSPFPSQGSSVTASVVISPPLYMTAAPSKFRSISPDTNANSIARLASIEVCCIYKFGLAQVAQATSRESQLANKGTPPGDANHWLARCMSFQAYSSEVCFAICWRSCCAICALVVVTASFQGRTFGTCRIKFRREATLTQEQTCPSYVR